MKKIDSQQKKDIDRNKRYLKTYGITLQDWLELYELQLGKCAICREPEEVCGKLCIDHIHVAKFKEMPPEQKKKYVRGLLCYLCNTGIKGFDKTKDGKKNRKRLEGTMKYFCKYAVKGEI